MASSSIGNILLNLTAAFIPAILVYLLSYLYPDLDENLRVVISLAVALIGFAILYYANSKFRRFREWLVKQWRFLVIAWLLILLEAVLYRAYPDWKVIGFSLAHFVLIAVAARLLIGYLAVTHIYQPIYQEMFSEDFQHGLENWEYLGEWRIEREDEQNTLIVTQSEKGGIAKPCLSWTNYIFEFETKIVNRNTSWIIRARDTSNYVMLQCGGNQIRPHYRVGGAWSGHEWIDQNTEILPVTLTLDTWFSVRVEVIGPQVTVNLKVNGEEIMIFSKSLLAKPVVPIDFAKGSVGFRESRSECARFRNVRVTRIL